MKTFERVLTRLVLFASPLGLACLLLGEFVLDESQYVRLLQANLFTIYAAAFLAALLHTRKNPRRDER